MHSHDCNLSYSSITNNTATELFCMSFQTNHDNTIQIRSTNIIYNKGPQYQSQGLISAGGKTILNHCSILGNIGEIIFYHSDLGSFEVIDCSIPCDQSSKVIGNFVERSSSKTAFVNEILFLNTGNCVQITELYQNLFDDYSLCHSNSATENNNYFHLFNDFTRTRFLISYFFTQNVC